MKTPLAIFVLGATGLAAIAAMARHYAGQDRVAFVVMLVMAATLCAGVAELLRVAVRTGRLRSELDRLPTEAEEEDLKALDPELQAMIRARLGGGNAPLPAPILAPFVIGLLVMLGLLGTFMGLFETVRGASQALTTSAPDVESLRTGLQTPMRGLMRSFGTSAAGIASSALLGLGVVLARNARARLVSAFQRVLSGPLAALAPSRRQLEALESLSKQLSTHLVHQGEALPKAAEALQGAVESLHSLRDDIRSTHAQSAEEMRAATQRIADALEGSIAEVAADVRAGFERGTAEAAQTTASQLRPMVEAVIERHAETSQQQLDVVREALADQRRAGQAAHEQTLTLFEQGAQRLLETQAEFARTTQAGLAEAAGAVGEQLARGVAAEQTQGARAETLVAELGQAREAFAKAAEEHAGRMDALAQASDARMQAAETASRERFASLQEALHENTSAQLAQLAAHSERLADTETRLLSQHEQSVSRVSELLADHAQRLDERLQGSSQLLEQAAGLVQAGGSELVTVAETFAAAVEQQRIAAQQWLESLGEIERSVDDAGEAAAADVLGQHLARTHEVFDRQLRFQQELIDQLHREDRKPPADEAHVDA